MTNLRIPNPPIALRALPKAIAMGVNSVRLHKRHNTKQRKRKLPHLVEKYGMCCYWCGCVLTPETLTINHYIPLSRGGSNKIKNLRLSCIQCNNKRGDEMEEYLLCQILGIKRSEKKWRQWRFCKDLVIWASASEETRVELTTVAPRRWEHIALAYGRLALLEEFTA
ncbi:MAG: HNH endonuclease [Microcoleus sp. SIO2G3]|nr:HNH endonuclease [Microcoleus sp. SIO2G3]